MDRGDLEVRLARVTAWLRNGLCRMTSTLDAPKLVGVQVECESSLLLANHEAPLVDQRGAGGRARLSQFFDWRGTRNEFYGFDVYWRMKELDAASTPDQLDFRAWQQYFTTNDAGAQTSPLVRTLLTLQSQPTHRLGAVEFELAESAQQRASQRRAEGVQADRLPAVFLAP
jgi:hypothetical protein